MLTVLFLLFSCYTAISTLDVKPFVSTAIDDFLTQKEAGSSDVFSVLIEDYVIDGSEIIGVTILPKDSRWKFLLSNEDSLGTSFVSISYIERDGKLFYWDTDDSCLTQEIYEVLLKYDFIERRNVPSQEYLLGERGYFQDGVKHYQYYFCKSNPNDYKRRYSSVAKLPRRMRCSECGDR